MIAVMCTCHAYKMEVTEQYSGVSRQCIETNECLRTLFIYLQKKYYITNGLSAVDAHCAHNIIIIVI